MNKVLLTLSCLGLSVLTSTAATVLKGSGATFPAPLYKLWAENYHKKINPDVEISYNGVGSGAGIKQFQEGVTDFGGSDVAMTDEEISKMGGNVMMIPITAGSVVLAYNIPGVGWGMKLSREAYVGIFLGTITKWNDPLIVRDNPGISMPNLPITVVTRADSSGTTSVFTSHLAAISPEFEKKTGAGRQVNWAVGTPASGNNGVGELIKKTDGSIGYLELGYADHEMLSTASLQNKSGNFIHPTISSGASTIASISLPKNLRAFATDPEGKDDYPITTFTWILVKKFYPDMDVAGSIKLFLKYALTEGQDSSIDLGYIPLPDSVVKKDLAAIDMIQWGQ